MFVICFVVFGMFVIFIYKYSYNKNVEFGKMYYNVIIEIIWFVIFIIIVVVLVIFIVKILYDYEKLLKSEKDLMVVYVVSVGYKWFFVYLDEYIEIVNILIIFKDRFVVFKF